MIGGMRWSKGMAEQMTRARVKGCRARRGIPWEELFEVVSQGSPIALEGIDACQFL